MPARELEIGLLNDTRTTASCSIFLQNPAKISAKPADGLKGNVPNMLCNQTQTNIWDLKGVYGDNVTKFPLTDGTGTGYVESTASANNSVADTILKAPFIAVREYLSSSIKMVAKTMHRQIVRQLSKITEKHKVGPAGGLGFEPRLAEWTEV